ncbi:MAG: prfB [Candidatus Saccharibacteria bacterium]|nr:prfB [Candidatus Saccharibacteria bacterium]
MLTMHELETAAADLLTAIDGAINQMKIPELEAQLDQLQADSQKPDFWSDNQRAQGVMKQIAKLEARVKPWTALQLGASETLEMVRLGDAALKDDLSAQVEKYRSDFETMKEELKLSGPYDDYDAILSIHAGAGGNDAQDWAGMLLRMYLRWAEKNNFSVQVIEESTGEEAGIKSVTVELSGAFVFGKLKGEHGVHRLVRLSPFNAESRETSFAKVEVMPKVDKPDEVAVDEKDLKIDVYRSGGHGGQSVNTTDSAVRITHLPTGIVVAIQNERSQLQNRETAMTILRSRLAQLQMEQHAEAISELKGPNEQAAWGNQIRSYVLHPYKQVKDLRSRYETSDIDGVLDGSLDPLINAYLEYSLGE